MISWGLWRVYSGSADWPARQSSRFVEIVVWQVPRALKGSRHRFKYRLALIVDGECVLRYDNEAGKGDHRHAGPAESPYSFATYERLLADFWADVDVWRTQHEDHHA